EYRHAELDRIGGRHLGGGDQLVLAQPGGDGLALGRGLVQRLAGGPLFEGAIHDQAPGDAGDADEIGGRDSTHGVFSSDVGTLPQARHMPQGTAPRIRGPGWRERAIRLPLARYEGETMRLSIILPAKNEADGLRLTLPRLREAQPEAELIV